MMKDTVPLGTGNSRTLKSGIDSNMTWEQFRAALISGSLPIDLGAVNPAGVAQVGDPLNKANLLPDDVASALGLTGNPQVAQALEKLSGAAFLKVTETPLRTPVKASAMPVGRVLVLKESGVDIPFIKEITNYNGSGAPLFSRQYIKLSLASAFHSSNSGTYSGSTLDNYLNTTVYQTLDSLVRPNIVAVDIASMGSTLQRKVFALSATELGITGAQHTEGARLSRYSTVSARQIPNQSDTDPFKPAGTGATVWTRSQKGADMGVALVTSNGTTDSSNTYKTYAYQVRYSFCLNPDVFVYLDADGMYYTEQKTISEYSIADVLGEDFPLSRAKIEAGSYAGTGTFGSGNKNSLTFLFEPKVVVILCNTVAAFGILLNPATAGINGWDKQSLTVSWSGNNVKWYNDASDNYQLNRAEGYSYSYIAIG